MQPLLTPEKITKIGRRLYGGRGWQIRLARALGTQKSTVYRWSSGKMKIDPIPAKALLMLEANHLADKVMRKALGA